MIYVVCILLHLSNTGMPCTLILQIDNKKTDAPHQSHSSQSLQHTNKNALIILKVVKLEWSNKLREAAMLLTCDSRVGEPQGNFTLGWVNPRTMHKS